MQFTLMPTFAISVEFNCSSKKRAIGLLIQLFRESKGLSRAQLEELADLPVRSVKEIEKGARGIDAIELQRIASVFGSPLDALVPQQLIKNGQNNTGNGLARSARQSQ